MTQAEFMKRVATVLRVNGETKRLRKLKQEFTISDDNGNSKRFAVGLPYQYVPYTDDDVIKIISAAIEVAKGALRTGDRLSFTGFGTFSIRYRDQYVGRNPKTGELVVVKGRYVPKFSPAAALRQACIDYEEKAREIETQANPVIKTSEDDEFYYEEDGNPNRNALPEDSIEVESIEEDDDFDDAHHGYQEDLTGFNEYSNDDEYYMRAEGLIDGAEI